MKGGGRKTNTFGKGNTEGGQTVNRPHKKTFPQKSVSDVRAKGRKTCWLSYAKGEAIQNTITTRKKATEEEKKRSSIRQVAFIRLFETRGKK